MEIPGVGEMTVEIIDREGDYFVDDRKGALRFTREGLRDRPDGQVELKCSPKTEAAIFGGGPFFDAWALAPRVKTPTLLLWATRGDFPRPVYVHRCNGIVIETRGVFWIGPVTPDLACVGIHTGQSSAEGTNP